MQKLKKNLRNNYFEINRHRKSYKNSNIYIQNSYSFFLNKKIVKILQLNIHVKQNNVFCSLIDLKEKKLIFVTSAGKEKTQTSRKKLHFSVNYIFLSFLKKIKPYIQKNETNLIIKITGPLRIKILLIKILKKKSIFNKKNIFLFIQSKKCFNGCKVSKKKRKKRKGLIIFK